MEEVISLACANGLWAVLFCILLVYELRDSRTRESKYTQTIRALSERLAVVAEVKTDTEDIKTDIKDIARDTKRIRSDAEAIKRVVTERSGKPAGGGKCANVSA